jgi:hypothetical protein
MQPLPRREDGLRSLDAGSGRMAGNPVHVRTARERMTQIRTKNTLDYGGAGTVPAGTLMEIKGERYNGTCWNAEWNGKAVVVPKEAAEQVSEPAQD